MAHCSLARVFSTPEWPWLDQAIIEFAKCFFGLEGSLSAALGKYLEPKHRDALVLRFEDNNATGVSGLLLCLYVRMENVTFQLSDGVKPDGQPRLHTFTGLVSDPSHFRDPAAAPDNSVVKHFLAARCGKLGMAPSAYYHAGEDVVATFIEWVCFFLANDGKSVLWGRGFALTLEGLGLRLIDRLDSAAKYATELFPTEKPPYSLPCKTVEEAKKRLVGVPAPPETVSGSRLQAMRAALEEATDLLQQTNSAKGTLDEHYHALMALHALKLNTPM